MVLLLTSPEDWASDESSPSPSISLLTTMMVGFTVDVVHSCSPDVVPSGLSVDEVGSFSLDEGPGKLIAIIPGGRVVGVCVVVASVVVVVVVGAGVVVVVVVVVLVVVVVGSGVVAAVVVVDVVVVVVVVVGSGVMVAGSEKRVVGSGVVVVDVVVVVEDCGINVVGSGVGSAVVAAEGCAEMNVVTSGSMGRRVVAGGRVALVTDEEVTPEETGPRVVVSSIISPESSLLS